MNRENLRGNLEQLKIETYSKAPYLSVYSAKALFLSKEIPIDVTFRYNKRRKLFEFLWIASGIFTYGRAKVARGDSPSTPPFVAGVNLFSKFKAGPQRRSLRIQTGYEPTSIGGILSLYIEGYGKRAVMPIHDTEDQAEWLELMSGSRFKVEEVLFRGVSQKDVKDYSEPFRDAVGRVTRGDPDRLFDLVVLGALVDGEYKKLTSLYYEDRNGFIFVYLPY